MEKFKVTFYPDGKSVEVERDRTILSAALSAGVFLNSNCGGDGVCGRCKVIVKRGTVASGPTGLLSAEEKKRGVHLACLASVVGDVDVEVLPESRLDFEALSAQEAEERLKGISLAAEEIPVVEARHAQFVAGPLVRKIYIELPRPSIDDNISDVERIARSIAKVEGTAAVQATLVNMRTMGKLVRDADWKVTVTLGRRRQNLEIIAVEAGDTSRKNYGVAFDIGTTTISGQLIDLAAGAVAGTKATYNRQAAYGADVITRIIFGEKEEGLEKLHAAATSCMNEIIRDLAAEHGVDLNDIACVVCAGNTTMIHLLLRIDPSFIRRDPYVPTANVLPGLRALDAGLKLNPRAFVFCVPGISSYVGGDTTSGVLSTGQDTVQELTLLIDIGTNGEVVLGNSEFLIATSASAGPAFEGSGVRSGMRSARGAIQKVSIHKDYDVRVETIGGARPRGICGSGYIDVIAEMLRCGLLDKDGKIKAVEHPRIRQTDTGREFVIVEASKAANANDIVISEADIDNIKRAKAAIYAACTILLRRMSVDFKDVKKIFIAGGFGTSLDIKNAVRIGLLPDLALERFVFVGNSSLAGARQIILSREAFDAAAEIARKMAYFELSTEPAYMDEYMAALFFPHTDLARFPSVKN